MVKYISKRILMLIPVILGVIFIVFFVMSLSPVNPAEVILGDGATAESIAAKEEELGLNDPFLIRFGNYVLGLLRGDMGVGWRTEVSVAEEISQVLPNTLVLAFGSMIIAIAIGIPLGIFSAKHQNSLVDNLSMILALVGISMPLFWLGLLLVIAFSVNLHWFPSSGFDKTSMMTMLQSACLPVITLATLPTAMITRMTRSSMLDVVRQDYIDTARAKGVKESIITRKHMLKNALIPIITIIGLQFGTQLSGAILTETVFSWPGIGRLTIEAIKTKDQQTVLGCVVVISLMFSVINLIVDILYAYVDPRIKAKYTKKR